MDQKETRFVATVREFYKKHGRHELPWRHTTDPYHILVSEMMLQQTQVTRVIPKFEQFVKRFPTVSSLARASLADVLVIWQGLGYNRRAKSLHECARTVVDQFKGVFPKEYDQLQQLPGIGPYTAGAIMVFAHNIAVPLIETNIRTVYIHHFFNKNSEVKDSLILKKIVATMDHKKPREWFAALMDYGSELKRTKGNNIYQSAHYKKQSRFKGSDRQVRGMIIRALGATDRLSYQRLLQLLPEGCVPEQLTTALAILVNEKMIKKRGVSYELPRISKRHRD